MFLLYLLVISLTNVTMVTCEKRAANTGQEDQVIDFDMLTDLLKMYFCTGEISWMDKIDHNNEKWKGKGFFIQQAMQLFSMAFCQRTEKEHSEYRASLQQFINWARTLPLSSKHHYGGCLETGILHSLRWAMCCGEVSKYHVASLLQLFRTYICGYRAGKETFTCNILAIISDQKTVLNVMFEVLKSMKVCECPTKLPEEFTSSLKTPKSTKSELKKRQFDAVSTSMIFSEIMCDKGHTKCKVHSPAQIIQSMSVVREVTDHVRQVEALVFVFRDVLCCFVA